MIDIIKWMRSRVWFDPLPMISCPNFYHDFWIWNWWKYMMFVFCPHHHFDAQSLPILCRWFDRIKMNERNPHYILSVNCNFESKPISPRCHPARSFLFCFFAPFCFDLSLYFLNKTSPRFLYSVLATWCVFCYWCCNFPFRSIHI